MERRTTLLAAAASGDHESESGNGPREKGSNSPAVGAVGVTMVALAALAVGVRADGVDGNDGLLCRRG